MSILITGGGFPGGREYGKSRKVLSQQCVRDVVPAGGGTRGTRRDTESREKKALERA